MTSVGLQLGQRWVQNFSRWGAERDAQLDIADVFTAIASSQVQGDDAAALACLYKAMRADFHASGDKAYPVVDKERLKSYLMRIQGDQLDYAFASYQAKIKGEPREPFHQGIAPSCTLISSAFALEQRDPNALESFVRQDEKGYHVQFPGVEKEIHFARLSDTERALHTSGLEAIEKAWGILEGGSEIGAIANAGGTGSERPITALTGNQAKSVLLPNPLMYNYLNAKLQSKKPGAPQLPLPALGPILAHLQQALADKALVTTGSWSQPVLKPGIQHAHAYSLVGLDMAAQIVKLRNPHGHGEPGNDGQDDGEFDLPIADWVANFNSVTIELAQPAQA